MGLFDVVEYFIASSIGTLLGFFVGFYIVRSLRRKKVADGDVVRALEIMLEIIKRVSNPSQVVKEISRFTETAKKFATLEDIYIPPVIGNAEKNFESTGQKTEVQSDVEKTAEALRKSLESRTLGK